MIMEGVYIVNVSPFPVSEEMQSKGILYHPVTSILLYTRSEEIPWY